VGVGVVGKAVGVGVVGKAVGVGVGGKAVVLELLLSSLLSKTPEPNTIASTIPTITPNTTHPTIIFIFKFFHQYFFLIFDAVL
jgi:hypothetical protein